MELTFGPDVRSIFFMVKGSWQADAEDSYTRLLTGSQFTDYVFDGEQFTATARN